MEQQGTFEGAKTESAEQIGRTIGEIKQRASDYARDVGARAVEAARESGLQGYDQLVARIQRDPLASVAVACGIGVFIGLLMRKGR